MQSLAQYRKFRKQVEEQYERHALSQRARSDRSVETPGSARHNPPFSPSSSSSSLPISTNENVASPQELGIDEQRTTEESQQKGVEKEDFKASSIDANTPVLDSPAIKNDKYNLKTSPTIPGEENLSRITTNATHRSTGTVLGITLTGVNVRARTTNEGGYGKVFVVGYEGGDDPMDPHNWSILKRISATASIATIGFVVGFASSIDASAMRPAADEFGVNDQVASLATGLYLIGFGLGALFAGPFSETLGRNPVYISTLTLFMIFVMASGLAPNIGSQLAFRFLAGFFGATPLTCAGGSISDLWSPMERVFAFPIFANAAFSGPALGPVVGGYIIQSSLVSWRWVEWSTLLMTAFSLGTVLLFLPETFPPTLLKWKACHLRDITGDQRYVAEIEIRGDSLWQRLRVSCYRPFLLFIHEPVIMLLSLYLTVIYIILFTFLDGYTYIFRDVHGTSIGTTGLCFLSIELGFCGASALVPLIYRWAKRELKKVEEEGGVRLPPEFRLWYAMLGAAPAIPISLFWMGWTSYPSISIWSSLGASVLFGYGSLCIFISACQYVIDVYESYAASALAFLTMSRYVVTGSLTPVGIPFYRNMGVQWTLTILGSISILLVPVPYLFYVYGKKIRNWSKYAVDRG